MTSNRASFAVAALVLVLSAGLMLVLGSLRSVAAASPISETAAKQQAPEATLPPPALPELTTEKVVEPFKGPSIASVTAEKEIVTRPQFGTAANNRKRDVTGTHFGTATFGLPNSIIGAYCGVVHFEDSRSNHADEVGERRSSAPFR